jgi:hypothetical protein
MVCVVSSRLGVAVSSHHAWATAVFGEHMPFRCIAWKPCIAQTLPQLTPKATVDFLSKLAESQVRPQSAKAVPHLGVRSQGAEA